MLCSENTKKALASTFYEKDVILLTNYTEYGRIVIGGILFLISNQTWQKMINVV